MSEVTPELFVDAVRSYHKTAAILAAVELDLFAKIGQGATTAHAIAHATGIATRGARILCDYLTIAGFLNKSDGSYSQTASTAAFINSTSPMSMASAARYLAAPEMVRLFLEDPTSYVRAGGATGLANMAPSNPVWVIFAQSMVPFIAGAAKSLAQDVSTWNPAPKKVLDVAAGSGMFGISVAKAVSDARITGLDAGNVLAVAKGNAELEGVADRYEALAGSAFDTDWGSGYDLVLLPNFLHHFDHVTCVGLLQKARECLSGEGRVVAVEFVPDEDRISPPIAATFAFEMLATTQHGDAFTASDFTKMAHEAGYRDIEIAPLPQSPEMMVEFLL